MRSSEMEVKKLEILQPQGGGREDEGMRVFGRELYERVGAKVLVYAEEVPTREVLISKIHAAFNTMREELLLGTVTVEMRKRCRACLQILKRLNGDFPQAIGKKLIKNL